MAVVWSAFCPLTAFANEECLAKKASVRPQIVLDVEIADPYIRYDRTIKQIHAEVNSGGTVHTEEGMQELWATRESTTLGYAQGAMASNFNSRFIAMPFDKYGTYFCPYFQVLKIHIFYRTLIRIPSELKEGGCVHDVVLEHEMRHHVANRESFERYMKQLEADLPQMVGYFERVPIRRSGVNAHFSRMGASIQDAVTLYIREYAQKEAAKTNALIDSEESYASEAQKIDACKESKHWRKTR